MKATGILALIVAAIACIVPLTGSYMTIVSAVLLAFGANRGLIFSLIAFGLNLVNILLLSPSVWVMFASTAIVMVIFLILIQLVGALVLFFIHKKCKKLKTSTDYSN